MTKEQANEIERILLDGGWTKPSRKKCKKDCQYLGKDVRYCTATTQESCENCKFYTPNIHAKLEMLMQQIIRHEGEEERKDKIINECHDEIKYKSRKYMKLENELNITIEMYKRELRRAEMVREFMRRWWNG